MNYTDIYLRFEDYYGTHDIICNAFGLPYRSKLTKKSNKGSAKYTIERESKIIGIIHGLGNGRLSAKEYRRIRESLIIVYDMDGVDRHPYLTKDSFINRYKPLVEADKDYEVKFIPTVFCAETILLHKLLPEQVDFSDTFSADNTSRMHEAVLEEVLKPIYEEHKDSWGMNENGGEVETLRVKHSRNFLRYGLTLLEMIDIMEKLGYSRFNTALFSWIKSRKISNVSSALTFDEAAELQGQFEERIKSVIDLDKTGLTYEGKIYK